MESYRRPVFDLVLRRLRERRRFLQVLAGPRQVGKTTLALQVLEALERPSHYASADDPVGRDVAWLEAQWDLGRLAARQDRRGAVLVLDEVQKVPGWSEIVKRLWDEDTRRRVPLRVLLLGSAPLLVQRGLTESLAGRFELVRVTHWSFPEMRAAFGWDLERYLFYGGYPGSAPLIRDPRRWAAYIRDSLIETTISRDVLLLARVDKPALLRQLFRLACEYSGQVLSYTKMLGQLQDAGNTTTLAHYLELLAGAGLVVGLEKFSGSALRRRGSSPKLLALNTALISATAGLSPREARANPEVWGRLVETAVGAHLVNAGLEVHWWRERNLEVDFVVRRGRTVVAIEVTSGRRKGSLPGMAAFARAFRPARRLLVGGQGIPLEEFLSRPAEAWIR
ncbi:MAG: ATPase AAA [Actinomycetota bacterium]|nr:MAG: ATPase AAA [Actinomycetota bacterium]